MSGNNAQPGRKVTDKVLAILQTFSHGAHFSLSEIARFAGLPMSTSHRLVTELVAAGALERAPNGHYCVGPRLRATAVNAGPHPPSVHELARLTVDDLAAACGRGTARFGVLDSGKVAFIEKADEDRPVAMTFATMPMPIHTTALGRVLLAFSPADVIDRTVCRDPQPYTGRLYRELTTIRSTGVAYTNREFDPSGFAAAVPVFGSTGTAVGAIELAVRRYPELRLVQPALVVAGRRLSGEFAAQHRFSSLGVGGDGRLTGTVANGRPFLTSIERTGYAAGSRFGARPDG